MFVRLTFFIIATLSLATCKSTNNNTQVKQDGAAATAEAELLTPTIWVKATSPIECPSLESDNCDVRIMPLQTESPSGSSFPFPPSLQENMRQSISSQINAALSTYATSAANHNSHSVKVPRQEMEARLDAIDIDALIKAVLSPTQFNNNSITWNATVGDFQLCEPSPNTACTASGNGAGGGSSIIYDQAEFALDLEGITMDPAETVTSDTAVKSRSSISAASVEQSRGSLGATGRYELTLIYNVSSTLDAGMKIDLVKFLGNMPAFGRLKNWIMGNFGDMLSAGFQFNTVNSTIGFQFTEFKPLYNGLSEFQISLLYEFLPKLCDAVVRKNSVWTEGFNCPRDSEGIAARLGLGPNEGIKTMIKKLRDMEWDASVQPILDGSAGGQPHSASTTIVSDSALSAASVTVPVAATEAETFTNVIHNEEAFLRAQKCEFLGNYAWIYFAAPDNYKESFDPLYGQFVINERQNQFGNVMSWSRQHSGYSQDFEKATDQSLCREKGGKNPTCYRVKMDWAWTNEDPLCRRINMCAGLSTKRSLVAIVKSNSQSYPQFDEFSTSGKTAADFIKCE
jgi:hypothetical protein